ncbi:MAG: amino acid ABC transporter substrate-binding protein, partial [Dolichospermum sp.]
MKSKKLSTIRYIISGIVTMKLVFSLTACSDEQQNIQSQMNTPPGQVTRVNWNRIKSRGQLVCGISGELPGFSFVGTDGKYSGIDVDICRAVAAAIFDNPEAVEY